jgi:glycosyltransferase involved in cell wall biosynthesis
MVNASPNKIYDAMAVGRPVLINREVRLAEWVEAAGVGFACDYQDIDGLRAIVSRLETERGALMAFAARARRLFVDRYQWAQMESRLAALYEDLGRADARA